MDKNEVCSQGKIFPSEGVVDVFNSSCEFLEFIDNRSQERVNVFGVRRTRNDSAE